MIKLYGCFIKIRLKYFVGVSGNDGEDTTSAVADVGATLQDKILIHWKDKQKYQFCLVWLPGGSNALAPWTGDEKVGGRGWGRGSLSSLRALLNITVAISNQQMNLKGSK